MRALPLGRIPGRILARSEAVPGAGVLTVVTLLLHPYRRETLSGVMDHREPRAEGAESVEIAINYGAMNQFALINEDCFLRAAA